MDEFKEYKATVMVEIIGHEFEFEIPYLDTNDKEDIAEIAWEIIEENLFLKIESIEEML